MPARVYALWSFRSVSRMKLVFNVREFAPTVHFLDLKNDPRTMDFEFGGQVSFAEADKDRFFLRTQKMSETMTIRQLVAPISASRIFPKWAICDRAFQSHFRTVLGTIPRVSRQTDAKLADLLRGIVAFQESRNCYVAGKGTCPISTTESTFEVSSADRWGNSMGAPASCYTLKGEREATCNPFLL